MPESGVKPDSVKLNLALQIYVAGKINIADYYLILRHAFRSAS